MPPDDPLWSLGNAHVSMHLSGRSQTQLFARNAERFLENLGRYACGEPLESVIDLTLGIEGGVNKIGIPPKPVYPELVEGLFFSLRLSAKP